MRRTDNLRRTRRAQPRNLASRSRERGAHTNANSERFSETFRPQGFSHEAFAPAYGLAEATLVVSVRPPECPILSLAIDAAALDFNRVRTCAPDLPGARVVTSVGTVLPDLRLSIVDPGLNKILGDDEIGEIWLQGAGLASGYWD